ncbi:MAG: hypothetical protein AUF79_00400 [Crenarchaeota archaeon 13_1_20CM_2_51_8]|nr:MAG: hypothetical protein AUF79_00400 [Crenarchaeota archaeon 13_1_20CM_2_51_8]
MSDRSARALGLLILSAMTLAAIPEASRIIPNAHGTSPVCQTVNKQQLYNPKGDWGLYAFYQTCGVLNPSGTWFVSTTHNVTIICIVPRNNQSCPDGDFIVNSGVTRFVGLNDTVTKYNISNHYNASAPPLPYEQIFSSTTTQSTTVDYAQSYWQFNITDQQSGGSNPGVCTHRFCVWTRAQFVGTSNAFELDWADGNNDGVVNNTDLNNVSAKYGKPDSYWDFDRSGTVDATDIARVSIHGGRSFGIANYPGQGCLSNSVESSNQTACPPLFGYPATTQTQVPRQGWKSLCGVFPDPDKTYCNYLPG